MSKGSLILHLGIIFIAIFVSLVAIPYLIPSNQTIIEAPSSPTENIQATTTPAYIKPPATAPKATLINASLPPRTAESATATAATTITSPPPESKFSALLKKETELGKLDFRDEQELWRSVVSIQCTFDIKNGGSETVGGSGVVFNKDGLVVTNNHVVNAGEDGRCAVLFPAFSENTTYRIRAYGALPATIIAKSGNNDNDVATLQIQQTEDFQNQIQYLRDYYGWTGTPFSYIPYPLCHEAEAGDKVIHYDWQVVNSAAQGYEILRTVGTITDFLKDYSGKFYYAQPDETPDYIVTDVKKFGGASGGLAFNATRDCFIGLTSRSGEVTYVINLNNPPARAFLPDRQLTK